MNVINKTLVGYGSIWGNMDSATEIMKQLSKIDIFLDQFEVVELGAGFGMWAGNLAMKGAKIIATDENSEPERNYPIDVRKLSVNQAIEAYPKVLYYLVEQPRWNIADTLEYLRTYHSYRPWILILIVSADNPPMIPDEFKTGGNPVSWNMFVPDPYGMFSRLDTPGGTVWFYLFINEGD